MASIVVEENGQKKITLPPSTRRFEPLVEFQRQLGISSFDSPEYSAKPWTLYTKLNGSYQLCFSYPSIFMGPATLPESSPDAVRMLSQCAGFRSEQRLPALTWANPVDGASLWRSSQPKIGIQGNRSMADEMVMKHIMDAAARANANRPPLHPIDATQLQLLTGSMDLKEWTVSTDTNNLKCALKILDLRPRSAAMANRTSGKSRILCSNCHRKQDEVLCYFFLKGYGYENTSNYPGATLQFCNIGNIHAVRDSYQKLATLCNNPNASDVQWNALVEDSKWLAQIRTILAAAWEGAFWVHVHRLPVLFHCSHGWDRTSQVCVLAQMMLDPYYRTVRGFTVLVEKDFMSFGHPFHTRCAHGEGRGDRGNVTSTTTSSSNANSGNNNNNSADEGQISPIFIQFLDCAYQIVSQYPECFEFNTNYLLMVSEHVYSCRFGNMLCDTERERELLAGIRQRTYSLWDFLEEPDQLAQVINPNYTSPDGVLLMPLPTLLRNVSLWSERHCKYGAKPTLRRSPPSPAVVAWTTTHTTTPTAAAPATTTEVAEELSTILPSTETNVPSTEVSS
jgi:myotubularin-related protein 1/2